MPFHSLQCAAGVSHLVAAAVLVVFLAAGLPLEAGPPVLPPGSTWDGKRFVDGPAVTEFPPELNGLAAIAAPRGNGAKPAPEWSFRTNLPAGLAHPKACRLCLRPQAPGFSENSVSASGVEGRLCRFSA